MGNYLRIAKVLIGVVLMLLLMGCEDGITGLGTSNDNVVSYEKSYNGHWEIYTNNIAGSNPQDISNYSGDDEYAEWSPNGNYILYSRRLPGDNIVVMVFNTKAQMNIQLTPDSGLAGLTPQWSPNGKISFLYRTSHWDTAETYLMSPDGSNKKKILSVPAAIYFYQDSYTFLYVDGTKIFKTNIDRTFDEFIVELQPAPGQFFTIRDFDSMTGEFLAKTNVVQGSTNAIATYSAEGKQLKVILTDHDGYTLSLERYSKDFSKIAFVETDTVDYSEEYLSVSANGEKRDLYKFRDLFYLLTRVPVGIHQNSLRMEDMLSLTS
jgi:Tol biopolymer transport system component